jgi:inhibitor of KinA
MDPGMKSLVPLGDQAALAYFEDEAAALAFASQVRAVHPPWLLDVVSSYNSAAVFFDLRFICFRRVCEELQSLMRTQTAREDRQLQEHRIPCCYEYALDMDRIAQYTHLSPAEVVRAHSGREYTVYAIGFCPGFPYLGYLSPDLFDVPRLASPRLRLDAGSVGLTGRQTGIYTEPRPGGWNIIGRTPLVLVDVVEGYFPIRTGDRVRFEPIDQAMFARLQGKRL